jgi:hypothetical protein
MQLGAVPSTGFELNTPEVVAVGVNLVAIAAVVGLTYLGLKAVLTGKNPLKS